eukprot:TRINITY_DN2437_c0_g4_i1.p1 TRINITY_DN2437_c0_g4~~TRINITY_DN2437_c0_g4_i1.p1  ORF type:complete len:354 (-),score=95.42 TRINITY_DN2437_c0_g4_i1:98-1129(-)
MAENGNTKVVKNDLLDENQTSSDYYYNSYAHFSIHEEMLKDKVRTLGYKHAIMDNPQLFKDKIVLDVGCGTGILSMFAAKAGAKKVYGIECSNIIHQAREIVRDNGLDGVVELIQAKVEEVELPVAQVDVIISEWMGYFCFYETMLSSVIFARDKWLVPGGVIMPDKAYVYVAGIEDGEYKEEKLGYWDNVYGFDMSCIRKLAVKEPLVDTVEADAIVTNAWKFSSIDINTVTNKELTFTAQFKITANRNDYVHALIAYFDVEFSRCHKPVRFSTSPDKPYTHWKQTVFYLQDNISICRGESIIGEFQVAPNKTNARDIDIIVSYKFDGKNGSYAATQDFRLR